MDRAPLVEGWGQDVRSTPREMICWTAAKEGQGDDGRRRGDQEVAAVEMAQGKSPRQVKGGGSTGGKEKDS